MEFSELIKRRYSVLSYQERPVEQAQLQAILEAGRLAPTARNAQPQRILVVQSEAGLAKMDVCTPCRFGAPVVLLVCYDQKANASNGNYARVDASIVLTHMMLKATELGLGTVWVGFFDPDELREQFKLPENYEIVSLLPLGHPAEDARPSATHESRLALEETVQYAD